MSPFEEGEEVDIRDYAPRKPAGYFENPIAAYVPTSFSGHSLSEVGESLLGHNFNDMLKRTEQIGSSIVDGSDTFNEDPSQTEASPNVIGHQPKPAKLKLDVLNPSTLRLSYQLGGESGSGWTMACQNKGSSLNFQMNHPLSSNVELGLSHETEARTSQVRMGISW